MPQRNHLIQQKQWRCYIPRHTSPLKSPRVPEGSAGSVPAGRLWHTLGLIPRSPLFCHAKVEVPYYTPQLPPQTSLFERKPGIGENVTLQNPDTHGSCVSIGRLPRRTPAQNREQFLLRHL